MYHKVLTYGRMPLISASNVSLQFVFISVRRQTPGMMTMWSTRSAWALNQPCFLQCTCVKLYEAEVLLFCTLIKHLIHHIFNVSFLYSCIYIKSFPVWVLIIRLLPHFLLQCAVWEQSGAGVCPGDGSCPGCLAWWEIFKLTPATCGTHDTKYRDICKHHYSQISYCGINNSTCSYLSSIWLYLGRKSLMLLLP